MKRKLKSASKDYTVDMLPHNRREVFFDILKLHWGKFLAYGLLVLVFSLPLHILLVIENLTAAGLAESANGLAQEQLEQLYLQIMSLSNTVAFAKIPCLLLLSVCIAGLVRIIRQYSWGENVFFSADFSQGIRQNGGQMALLAFAVGAVNWISVYAYNTSTVLDSDIASSVLLIPVGLAIFAGIPTAAYAVVQISVYSNRFGRNLLIGLVVAAKSYGKTLLAIVCCLLPFGLQLLPNLLAQIVGCVLGSMTAPYIFLAWFLFASNQLDRCINADQFPELVGRGTVQRDHEAE